MSALMNHASTLYPANRASKSGDRDSSGDVRFGSRKFTYLCIDNVTKLNLKPTRKEQLSIEQMFGTTRRNVEVYNVTMQLLAVEGFSFEVEYVNSEKDVLTYLQNPNIPALTEEAVRPVEKSDLR